MSKSRGNTVEPMAVMERHGADAVRLFLVTASQVWKPRSFDEAVIRGDGGPLSRHAEESVQRRVRAVREFRMGAVAGGSGAR